MKSAAIDADGDGGDETPVGSFFGGARRLGFWLGFGIDGWVLGIGDRVFGARFWARFVGSIRGGFGGDLARFAGGFDGDLLVPGTNVFLRWMRGV